MTVRNPVGGSKHPSSCEISARSQIRNIRLGFATNSSSSHSLVWAPGMRNENVPTNHIYDMGSFILANEADKLQYLGQQLKLNLLESGGLNKDDAAIVASHHTGVEVSPNGNIDHQSAWRLPISQDGSIDYLFFEDLKSQFLKAGTVVIGGCDEEVEERIQKLNLKSSLVSLLSQAYSPLRARKDSRGYWTIFNSKDGTRVRLSLSGEEVDTSASDVPESVEAKITNTCYKGCQWCYQSSHSRLSFANRYAFDAIEDLAEMGLFEIVFGGGDPCEAPDFVELMKFCRSQNVVPNFSTKNYSWLREHSNLADLWGSVGMSVNCVAEMADAAEVAALFQRNSVCFQIVVGTQDEDELVKMLSFASYLDRRVLLLGFKQIGRASSFKKMEFDINALLQRHESLPRVSIDTLLVKDVEGWLRARSNPVFWTSTEGTHSMYVDLVENYIAPSSFSDQRYYFSTWPLDLKSKIQEHFPFGERRG